MTISSEIINKDMMLIFTARFLESEYGEGAIEALAQWKNERNKKRWKELSQATGRNDPEYLYRLFTDRVHKFDVIRKNPEALEVIVTRCAHEQNMKQFNATDVGARMICDGDYAVVEGFNPKIRFERPKTLMKGDDCCHFIFELKPES